LIQAVCQVALEILQHCKTATTTIFHYTQILTHIPPFTQASNILCVVLLPMEWSSPCLYVG
jgi:hypothetical protein